MDYKCYYLSSQEQKHIHNNPLLIWNKHKPLCLKQFKMNSINDSVKIQTMCCYSKDYFYILVKSSQDSLINNDRAYQNGDGFHFVVANPKNFQNPTDEFYVIGISPLSDNWMNCFVWYKNIDLAAYQIKNSKVSNYKYNNEMYFIVEMPWHELNPLKPFIFNEYGFNISYVQASPNGKNVYILKEDECIQQEQSLREYEVFSFQKPYCNLATEIILGVKEKHIEKGKDIHINIGINSSIKGKVNLNISNNDIIKNNMMLDLKKGLNIFQLLVNTAEMDLGNNKISINLSSEQATQNESFNISIFDLDILKKVKNDIETLKKQNNMDLLIKESIITLQFQYDSLVEKLNKLRDYESFDSIEESLKALQNSISLVQEGMNLFKQGEPMRLAFKSSYDESLQPYSIYIPNSAKDKQIRKLVISLHGSGSDDTSVFNNHLDIKLAEEQDIIIAAPFARGTSHCYCPEECLCDVVELTKKLVDLFNIDKSQVFLSGFSMGGYGVLRVYDYCPKIYKGIIILSGHYNLASDFGYKGEPNYIEDENIMKFSMLPMIIFHGEKDMNCSYEEMRFFIQKIQNLNPEVKVFIDKNIGHSGLTENWYSSLSEWLKSSNI